MTNRYLEKIAKQLSEKELNTAAWKTVGYGLGGSIAASTVTAGLGGPAGDMAGRAYHLNKLKPVKEGKGSFKTHAVRGVKSFLHGAAGGLGGALAGGAGGAGIGAGIGAAAGALKGNAKGGAAFGAMVGGAGGAIAGSVKGNQMGTRHHIRKLLKNND